MDYLTLKDRSTVSAANMHQKEEKLRCRYGTSCFLKSRDHFQNYWHPDATKQANGPEAVETPTDVTPSVTILSEEPQQQPAFEAERRQSTAERTINILLLGATGIGKSTWINACANYLRYDSLDEAANSPSATDGLISTSFSIVDAATGENRLIVFGCDENEVTEIGESATQLPRGYVFDDHDRGLRIRIIDTPGLVDVRGPVQDKENMRYVLWHLANVDELSGIVILMKSSETKSNPALKFCVEELLTHLHRDAIKNVVICYTNARGQNYKVGDGHVVLSALLKDLHCDDVIQLSKENVYCMDNEAMKYVIARQQGVTISDKVLKHYTISWNKSSGELSRLLRYVAAQKPHSTRFMLTLNSIRNSVVALSRPMTEISMMIEQTMAAVKQEADQLLDLKRMEHLKAMDLAVKVPDLEIVTLENPRTVCTSPKCVQMVKSADGPKIHFQTVCCSQCDALVVPNQIGCEALQMCDKMQCSDGPGTEKVCSHCGCSWRVHMHITYHTRRVVTKILPIEAQQKVKAGKTAVNELQQRNEKLKAYADQMREEKKQLDRAIICCGKFLKLHAINPSNNAVSNYLDYCRVMGKSDDQTEKQIMEPIRIIREAIDKGSTTEQEKDELRPEAMNGMINALYILPHVGPILQKFMTVVEEKQSQAAEKNEKFFVINPSCKATKDLPLP